MKFKVKFVNRPSPHPGPLPLGEGGQRPGEGSVADIAALLGGLRSLATSETRLRSCGPQLMATEIT